MEPPIETILFVLWRRNKTSEKWLRALNAIRAVGILDLNVDSADGRGLMPILSFAVETTEIVVLDDTVVESR